MVNPLADSEKYKNKALFLAHDADDRTDPRKGRYAQAKGSSGQTLPLVFVDSGFRYTEASAGGNNFAAYTRFVDDALQQPPLVEIGAYYDRVGATNTIRVTGAITNVSQITFSFDNKATLWLIAFERTKSPVIHLDRFVWKSQEVAGALDDPLPPGGTTTFTEQMDLAVSYLKDPSRKPNMPNVQLLVLVDYQPNPSTSQAFNSAQAFLADSHMPPAPPANDNLADRIYFEQLPYTHTVDTTYATDEADEAVPACGGAPEKGVWYEYSPFTDETVTFGTSASTIDTVLSVWMGTPLHPISMEMGCSTDKNTPIVLDLEQDMQYYIKVSSRGGTGGMVTLDVTRGGAAVTPTAPPSATTPPATVEPTTPAPTTPAPETMTPGPPGVSIFLPQAKRNIE